MDEIPTKNDRGASFISHFYIKKTVLLKSRKGKKKLVCAFPYILGFRKNEWQDFRVLSVKFL